MVKDDSLGKLIGLGLQRPELYAQALTHRSAGRENYERLEFLGDALVNMLVAEMLFERFPQSDEGDLTRLRANLVKEAALADVARELELGKQLRIGLSEMRSGGWRRSSILADAFEALIGAIYLDQGFEACRGKVREWIGPRVAAIDSSGQFKDAKTRLQEWLQARRLALPEYPLVGSSGADHAKTFEVECRIDTDALPTRGSGSSRRHAEQIAAEQMLHQLEGPA